MTQNELNVSRLFRMADDPKRAARIARLARGVCEETCDEFFRYTAYAVETHADMVKCAQPGVDAPAFAQSMRKERDSLIRTAFAQAVP